MVRSLMIMSIIMTVLSACEDESDAPMTIEERRAFIAGTACPADEFAWLVGKFATLVGEQIFPEPTRIIAENQAVTMDYRADRMNVSIIDNTIDRVYCG